MITISASSVLGARVAIDSPHRAQLLSRVDLHGQTRLAQAGRVLL